MSIVRELAVKFGLDVDAASFAEGELAAKAVEKGLEAIVEVAKEAIEFLIDLGKDAIETASALNDTSQAIGVTTDALQELQYAGGLAGISAEEMTQAITILSKTMAKAATGGEEQAKAFSKIGVKVKDATGHLRPAEDVIGDIADHFAEMPDGAEKTAQAVELFGRSGARMVSMLNEGSEGLEELRKEAHELGLVMDDDTIKLGDDVGDNVDRIKQMWNAIKVQVGSSLLPTLKRITDGVIDWAKANKELIKQRIAQVVGAIRTAVYLLRTAFDVLSTAVHIVTDNMDKLMIVAGALGGAFLVMKTAAIEAALSSAAAWITAAAPFIAIASAIGAILLVLDDVRRFKEGRSSLLGLWANTIAEWQKDNKNDPWWLKAIKELVIYMERALGVANKLGIGNGDKRGKSTFDYLSPTEKKLSVIAPLAGIFTAKAAYRKSQEQGGSVYGYERAREAGLGPIEALSAAGDFSSGPPSLPPGEGVMRAPIHQDNRRSYVIQQSPGMSAQEVVDLITQYDQDANDAAAAALR